MIFLDPDSFSYGRTYAFYGYKSLLMLSVAGIVFEVYRRRLISSAYNENKFIRILTPGKKFARRLFLLVGFVNVCIFAPRVPGDPQVFIGVGGALVYVISRYIR